MPSASDEGFFAPTALAAVPIILTTAFWTILSPLVSLRLLIALSHTPV